MAFPDKTLIIDGQQVLVTCVDMPPDGTCHRYMFTATVGGISHQQGMGVGASEGQFEPVTAEQLQKDVDAVRESVARLALTKHAMKALEAGIV
jgi:hypothetical protein